VTWINNKSGAIKPRFFIALFNIFKRLIHRDPAYPSEVKDHDDQISDQNKDQHLRYPLFRDDKIKPSVHTFQNNLPQHTHSTVSDKDGNTF
jgi:hypothetical protein